MVGTASEDWLGVPLKTNGRIIGVMAVQSYTEGVHFQQKDVDLIGIRVCSGVPGDRTQAIGGRDPQPVIDR